jgi:hypothetical protein
MGHHRWTDDHDGALEFLSNMIPDYIKAQEQKLPLKEGFYRNVTAKFKERFPQIPTTEEIQKYGREQAQQVADRRLFDVSASSQVEWVFTDAGRDLAHRSLVSQQHASWFQGDSPRETRVTRATVSQVGFHQRRKGASPEVQSVVHSHHASQAQASTLSSLFEALFQG